MRADIPVLGHCFGAQMLAKAMGASVSANPMPQIGWGRVYTTRSWLSGLEDVRSFDAFHWHYESFSIPERAQRILFGGHCLNKGFRIGRHIGLQCHLEVTEETLRRWCRDSASELQRLQNCPMVQQADEILRMVPSRLPALQRVAGRVYREWTAGLERPRLHCFGHAGMY